MERVIPNPSAVEIAAVPVLPFQEFRERIVGSVQGGLGLSALFACPQSVLGKGACGAAFRIFAVLRDSTQGVLRITSASVESSYAALTPDCPAAHLFEREIAEQWGLKPEGHPWLKPVRFPSGDPACGDASYYRVEGDEVHEVAVGPVHAGVIEPGHFRFQCHGEKVFHLEISLGYQHRGVEKSLLGGPDKRSIHFAETLAGDTTIGHATAYCQSLECLARQEAPPRAQAIRGIALELERIANHIGDLGALAGDVGYLPTMSWCGRIRGDVLNMTALICGSRFGRGLVRPGGVGFDIDRKIAEQLEGRLASILRDAKDACDLLWKTPSVLARFEGTGAVSNRDARAIGMVGPAARACGIEEDARHDLPFGIFRFSRIPVSSWRTGDVFARAYVRWLEVQRSAAFISEQLRSLPAGDISASLPSLAPDTVSLNCVEGWRGEICHAALTGSDGRLTAYKIVDPSFHNWFGLALSLRMGEISDFPLCNKSFNLSYCGHDL
jgi:Ni,Fe-hydrogenase III large subunit